MLFALETFNRAYSESKCIVEILYGYFPLRWLDEYEMMMMIMMMMMTTMIIEMIKMCNNKNVCILDESYVC